eukprot:431423-Prorocentrum_minimum.AAC.1
MGEEVHKSHVTSAIKPGASRLEAGLRTQQAVLIQDIRGGGTYTLCHRGLLVAKGILVDGARRRLLLRMGSGWLAKRTAGASLELVVGAVTLVRSDVVTHSSPVVTPAQPACASGSCPASSTRLAVSAGTPPPPPDGNRGGVPAGGVQSRRFSVPSAPSVLPAPGCDSLQASST